MKPNSEFITIGDNEKQIIDLLTELVLRPRLMALKWSEITDQTPNMKVGYPGQHLASLILGMKGTKTGARGNDIIDGSEVKSCSRVDASDKCKSCKKKVLRSESKCSICGSLKIERDNTSKWLFTIRNKNELKILTTKVQRVVLVLADYPEFNDDNFNKIQFQAFEIWNSSGRCKNFNLLMRNYYHNIYLINIGKKNSKTPAPKNLWPYSYQFYLCNPVKIFSCIVDNANVNPTITINTYVAPDIDRSTINSERMPTNLLNQSELMILSDMKNKSLLIKYLNDEQQYQKFTKAVIEKDKESIMSMLPYIDEDLKQLLPLREDTTFEIKTTYSRM